MNEGEPFLKRWSRRKIEAREGPDQADAAPAKTDTDARLFHAFIGGDGDNILPI